MSFLATAAALAAALSTVDGCTGYTRMPTATRVGDGWPLMGRGERAAGDAFTVAWRVRVAVPGNDELAALEWFDDRWDALFYALTAAGANVDGWAPYVVVTKQGDVWVYEIICRTGE